MCLELNVQDLKFVKLWNMNSIGSNILSLKYQRFTPPGWKDIGIRKDEFVAKPQLQCIALPLLQKITVPILFLKFIWKDCAIKTCTKLKGSVLKNVVLCK